VAAKAVFPDHHAYTERDIRELLGLRAKHKSGGFVTTEKDAINLKDYLEHLQPITVIPLKMELVDGPQVLDTILGTIAERMLCEK
jgi:tetraacyldisaccharide-1-P 4'-kinase